MKKLIFIIAISFFTQEVWCQAPGGCGISYEYNAMGQRVKRSKLCNGGGSNLRPSNNSSNEIENQTRLLEIKVFPNPTNEQITVNFSTFVSNATIELMDINSKVIFQRKNLNGMQFNFDISALAQGVYAIVVKQEGSNSNFVQKVVKN